MADKVRFEPESFQIVSDLGQLRLFANPMKMRILRILQRQEATIPQLSGMVGEPEEDVARHLEDLTARRLVRMIDRQVREGRIRDVYRATALIYQLPHDPAAARSSATSLTGATLAAATMDTVTSELITSIETWPDQRMNYEGRRVRMPYARAEEFNEKLVSLVNEYWGSPDQPREGDQDDPRLHGVLQPHQRRSWRLSDSGIAFPMNSG